MKRAILLATAIWLSTPGIAAAQDSAGCQDPPLLKRLAGCQIAYCSKSDSDGAEMIVNASGSSRTRRVEGKIEKIHYECRGRSAPEVRGNAEKVLRAAGFEIDFTGYDVPEHYLTGHKGGLWVALTASEMSSDSSYDFTSVQTAQEAAPAPNAPAAVKAPAGGPFGKWAFTGKDSNGVDWSGSLTVGKLDPERFNPEKYDYMCELDLRSANSGRGVGAPCTYDAKTGTLAFGGSRGLYNYSAVLSPDGASLSQGKWREFAEDNFGRKTAVITKTGEWSARRAAK
jgi:hypothetical protein